MQMLSLPVFTSEAHDPKLATGGEACATVLHQDPLDAAAANGAGFASLMSNLKVKMGCAQLAPRHMLSVPNVY